MSPQMLQLLIWGVETAIKEVPAFASDIKAVLSKPTPTSADFQALRDKIAGESYAKLVPHSALPQS